MNDQKLPLQANGFAVLKALFFDPRISNRTKEFAKKNGAILLLWNFFPLSFFAYKSVYHLGKILFFPTINIYP
ncbi:hypothetical protein ACVWYG_000239 [Pedobacter sp. UYEF25]